MAAEAAESGVFDVTVAGGGMVGCALCCALAGIGLRVALVETRPPEGDWPAGEVDLRVSALTRASQRILANLGAWDAIVALRASPYREMEVWDAGGRGRIHFDAADVGEPDLGHIVENRVIRRALWERLAGLDGVTLHAPDEVVDIGEGEGGSRELRLASGRRLQTRLLVGAEGARSPVREMAGIHSTGWSYEQKAIVATVETEIDHGEVARQRFMPEGPLALLPINDGRCSIVWSTTPARADELLGLDDAAFCRALTAASDGVLGEVLAVGPRGGFPLALRHADSYIAPRLVLVGDAAHGVHPLAGQGVNLGFLDAAVLADVLDEAKRAGRPVGGRPTLRRYERARKGGNIAMLGAMDLFKRLFGNDRVPLVLLRNLGLTAADRAGPLKQALTRRAMGLSGELPRLAQPWAGSSPPGEGTP